MLLMAHCFTRGIDFNTPNAKGNTIMHYLCDMGNLEEIKLLFHSSMSHHINVNALNNEGRTPFTWRVKLLDF